MDSFASSALVASKGWGFTNRFPSHHRLLALHTCTIGWQMPKAAQLQIPVHR